MDEKSFKGNPGGKAELRYDLADFHVLKPGGFVLCALTGDPIPLEELRYWNPGRQEAYRDAVASATREWNLKKTTPASAGAATATAPARRG
jgi:hypothetical protein